MFGFDDHCQACAILGGVFIVITAIISYTSYLVALID